MKKQKQIISIGENFTIERKKVNYNDIGDFMTLYQCYERPSDSKIYIYNKYDKMLYDNCESVEDYGVKSYNTFTVNLHAIIRINGEDFYAVITPSYNRLYRIESEA